ncbi:hypothetical protein [Micromonospora deserti]|uniref:hypothetical protein n=1 Tax=Micromonospora deserti TaxID=2070366 RepID=UPI001F402281|nr:hypothetical protein [Micromonospora deserti]
MTAPDPLGPVVITARDIYDALIKLTDTVNKLVGQGSGHDDDIRDHEDRIRALERGRWPLPSLAALVSIAALVVAVVGITSR